MYSTFSLSNTKTAIIGKFVKNFSPSANAGFWNDALQNLLKILYSNNHRKIVSLKKTQTILNNYLMETDGLILPRQMELGEQFSRFQVVPVKSFNLSYSRLN